MPRPQGRLSCHSQQIVKKQKQTLELQHSRYFGEGPGLCHGGQESDSQNYSKAQRLLSFPWQGTVKPRQSLLKSLFCRPELRDGHVQTRINDLKHWDHCPVCVRSLLLCAQCTDKMGSSRKEGNHVPRSVTKREPGTGLVPGRPALWDRWPSIKALAAHSVLPK
jgi:hypothetical protein